MSKAELKLNLGSGDKRIEGFVNVDYSEECKPDIIMDLEQTPWNFEQDSVSHILMNHVLEHLGHSPRNFLAIMKELYRICRNDALIDITVPHPAHDNFISDPTHVRPITIMTLELFDRDKNLYWRKGGFANSPLALQCNVNFKILNVRNRMDQSTADTLKGIETRDPALAAIILRFGRNVISESSFRLKVIKP
jgi:hypothetical protein